VVSRRHGRPAASVHGYVMRLVETHGAGVPASDDQTLMVIRHGESEQRQSMRERPNGEITLEANHLALRGLGPWLAEVFAGTTSDAAALSRLELGLHELCTNVVDHSYRGGPGRIRIAAWLRPGEARFELLDVGAPFDSGRVRRPVPGVPQIRGYGLMLIEQLVDSVRYERAGDENIWTVITRWEP
jgi:serine/threonine-protein kinase RsbW